MSLQSFVNSIVFSPPGNSNTLQAVQLLQHKRYMDFVRKKDGQCIAYYHLAPGGGRVTSDRLGEVTSSSTVILLHHGNAEDLGGCYNYAEWFAASFGMAVVMYDYCGYGYSGLPNQERSSSSSFVEITEKTVYSDADDMYAHLLKLGYPAHRIVILGRSVGGGPACYLAQKHHKEIAGLILISTFTSCLRVVSSCCLPFFCRCVDLFPNYHRIEDVVECPVLIMHGTDDRVVPYHCSGELLARVEKRRRRVLRRLQRSCRKQTATGTQATGDGALSMWKATAALSMTSSNSMSAPRPSAELTRRPSLPGAATEPVSAFDLFQRAYLAIPEEVRNTASLQVGFDSNEVQIGTFHKWFPGCGHNDIENREMEVFTQAIMWFVRFAKAFAAERGRISGSAVNNSTEIAVSRE